MPTVEGAGVALAVTERGEGPAALIVHDLAADAQARAPLAEALAAGCLRAIAYDRRGYGGSGAPVPYLATTVQEQTEDAVALLGALDAAPALVVGEGLGALVALDLLVRHPALARGAVLADPPLHAFVPEATEVLATQRQALEQALRDGGPQAAVEAWLGGRADPDALGRARAAHGAFFADFGGLASWSPTRAELRALRAPVAVVTGPRTPAHVRAGADTVARLVPGARSRTDGDAAAAAGELTASASRGAT